jgi:hypothetical protein
MSRPRHRKKPARQNKPAEEEIVELQPDDGELPTLEPVEDGEPLAELEAADELEVLDDEDAAVKVRCQPTQEHGFDTEVKVTVPEMDKQDVPDAIRTPLANMLARSAAALRYKRVVVDFEGEANIGTAAKTLVGDLLVPGKPLKLVVRRGYGDELLHEGKLPTADASIRADGDNLRVHIDGGELDVDELKVALEPTFAKLMNEARGKAVVVYCDGKAGGAPGIRDLLRSKLRDAGADKAHLGDAMLFDRTLENRVRFSAGAGVTTIQVTPAEDDAQTLAALDLMLQPASRGFGNQKLVVQFVGRAPRQAELDRTLHLCTLAKPERVEVAMPGAGNEVYWPRMLELNRAEHGIEMRVKPNGRSTAAVLAAFARECAALTPKLVSQRVTVMWPADFAFDDAAERCMVEALEAHAPRNVGCTFGDDRREPFWPTPVTVEAKDGTALVRIDGETGKPPELARALERRLRVAAERLRGQRVQVEMQGGATLSRTLLRTLRDEATRAGASRLEVNDNGTLDLLVPALLDISDTGKDAVTIKIDACGRTDAAVDAALQRELEAAELPAKSTVTVAASAFTEKLTAALVARGTAKVLLDGAPPVQIHPPLFTAGRNGAQLTLRATPAGGDDAVAAQVERELPALLARGDLGATTITLLWPGAKSAEQGPLGDAVAKLVAAAPQKLLLDDGKGKPRQVFPEVVLDYVTVLGRRTDEAAPVVMLGIDAGSGEAHLAKVMGKLETLVGELYAKRVMLVVRHEGRDLVVPLTEPMFGQICKFVAAHAAATMTFGGIDPTLRRPFFVTVHSKVEGLKRGARFTDPRFKRPAAPANLAAPTKPVAPADSDDPGDPGEPMLELEPDTDTPPPAS